ncbi:MAG: polymorphic toxin type 15 domain-containing protein [Microbacterium sp.]
MNALRPILREAGEATADAARQLREKLPVLFHNIDGHFDDIIRQVKRNDVADVPATRIDVSVKAFTRNKNHSKKDFTDQRDEQIAALQKMSVAQWVKNRTDYATHGRTPESLQAQQATRDVALKTKIAELRASGQSRTEAAENAQQWLSTQAATHRLDGIAGGNLTDISGVGHSGVNSSLGSQWRSRVTDIDAAVNAFVRANPGVNLDNVFMNVAFR